MAVDEIVVDSDSQPSRQFKPFAKRVSDMGVGKYAPDCLIDLLVGFDILAFYHFLSSLRWVKTEKGEKKKSDKN